MSTDRDVNRIVRSWLEEGVTALPDRVLDTVLDQLPATSQRRAWWPARRFQEMNAYTKFAVAAAAVVAVAVVGINLLPGQGGIGRPGAVSPSPIPSQSDPADPLTVGGSSLRLTAQLPEGWESFDFGASRALFEPQAGIAFFVSVVDNTFEDPCAHTQRDPKVGSTVEALATALGEVPNSTATEPVQTTIAGHEATSIELTIPASLPCAPEQFYLWQDSPNSDWWVLEPNEVIRVWILEVEGERVAIAARSYPGTSEEAKAELQRILDSITFEPPPASPLPSPSP